MKILRLTIQNFMGIGWADLYLSDKGLVGIQGENLDDSSTKSNGSGKSTIVEALEWVIYNSTSKGVTGDSVVNVKAKKDCFVEVVIQDGDNIYTIKRWRKKNIEGKKAGVSVILTKEETETNLTKGTDKLTQEVIEHIMGCSKEVFRAAVYSGQETMPDIPNMTDRQLKTLIEEAAGLTRIEFAYDVARKKVKEASERVADLFEQIRATDDKIEWHSRQIKSMTDSLKEWEEKKSREMLSLKEKQKSIKAEIQEEQDDSLHYTEEDLSIMEKRIRDSMDRNTKDIDSYQVHLDEISDRKEEIKTIQRMVDGLRAKFRKLSDKRDYWEQEIEDSESKIGTSCTSCGKSVLPEDIVAVVESMQGEVYGVSEKMDECLQLADEGEIDIRTKEIELRKYTDKVKDLSVLLENRDKLNKAIRNIVDKRNVLKQKEYTINTLKEKLKNNGKEIVRCHETENPYVGMTVGYETDRKKLQDLREELNKLFEEAEQEEDLAVKAAEIFGPKGVRAKILDTVTPFLNERTAEYLSALSDGNISAVWTTITMTAKGEARENFSVEVRKNGMGQNFQSISGGEKRKVRLACALALQDLVASRVTKPIELWIGDEIDDALDEAGLERLMVLLEQKARERGTVLVVSHRSLKDWIREHTIVTMKDNKATVSGALCVE